MNSTNRASNRLLILIVGLFLVVAGAAAAAVVLIPVVRDTWKAIAGDVNAQVASWLQATPLGDTGVSWIMPAVLVVLALAVILLIVFIVRQGRGHTRTVLSEGTSEHGRTEIDASLAANALEDAIGSRPEFIASHVSAYRVRRTPVLKVAVTCRRGVSPKDAADIVDGAVRALDELLGRPLPALVQISGGFRARTGSSTRLQ
jgi:flagellar basal body-associated protein FliL